MNRPASSRPDDRGVAEPREAPLPRHPDRRRVRRREGEGTRHLTDFSPRPVTRSHKMTDQGAVNPSAAAALTDGERARAVARPGLAAWAAGGSRRARHTRRTGLSPLTRPSPPSLTTTPQPRRPRRRPASSSDPPAGAASRRQEHAPSSRPGAGRGATMESSSGAARGRIGTTTRDSARCAGRRLVDRRRAMAAGPSAR
jgi:hypothetical protein